MCLLLHADAVVRLSVLTLEALGKEAAVHRDEVGATFVHVHGHMASSTHIGTMHVL